MTDKIKSDVEKDYMPFKLRKEIVVNRPLYYPMRQSQKEAYKNLKRGSQGIALSEKTLDDLRTLHFPLHIVEMDEDSNINVLETPKPGIRKAVSLVKRDMGNVSYVPKDDEWTEEMREALYSLRRKESFGETTKERMETLGCLFRVYEPKDDIYKRLE